jgi:hypothetical protein
MVKMVNPDSIYGKQTITTFDTLEIVIEAASCYLEKLSFYLICTCER